MVQLTESQIKKICLFQQAYLGIGYAGRRLNNHAIVEVSADLESRGYALDTDIYVLKGLLDDVRDSPEYETDENIREDVKIINRYADLLYDEFDLGSDENNTELKQIRAWIRRQGRA